MVRGPMCVVEKEHSARGEKAVMMDSLETGCSGAAIDENDVEPSFQRYGHVVRELLVETIEDGAPLPEPVPELWDHEKLELDALSVEDQTGWGAQPRYLRRVGRPHGADGLGPIGRCERTPEPLPTEGG